MGWGSYSLKSFLIDGFFLEAVIFGEQLPKSELEVMLEGNGLYLQIGLLVNLISADHRP